MDCLIKQQGRAGNRRSYRIRLLWSAVLVAGSIGTAFGADAAAHSGRFGFTGPEIFPIDNQISLIRAVDLDGDGLLDLVVANNARSKINFLYNQTKAARKTTAAKSGNRGELNELPPDARFRIESIASEKRISSLVVTDLNGDQKPDLAYYGEPKELVVQYNLGDGGWGNPRRWQIEDGVLSPGALSTGDLNGDRLSDLVLLGENHIFRLLQKADHTFGEPERIPFSPPVRDLEVLDVNHDGREDLLMVSWDGTAPFRARLQDAEGRLGPENFFTGKTIRSYLADDLFGDGRSEVVAVRQNSGRAHLCVFTNREAESLVAEWRQGPFQVFPLNKTAKAKRGQAWVDINGDHRPDLLVADPESGLLNVYLQQDKGGLAGEHSFPCLTGVGEVLVMNWTTNSTPAIFVLSQEERQLGVTGMDAHGHIAFPKPLSLEGKPLVMAGGNLQRGGSPILAVIEDLDGKKRLNLQNAQGQVRTQTLGDNFKSKPVQMSMMDVDQDERMDLVILIPYEKIKILRQTNTLEFEELDVAPPGGVSEQPWMAAADVDADGRAELLLAQKNFVRAVVLARESRDKAAQEKSAWNLDVKEQINGATATSRITSATVMSNDRTGAQMLFLLDAGRKNLSLCTRDTAGVWQVTRSIELPVAEFSTLQPLRMGESGPDALAFLGVNAVAVQSFGGSTWQLEELSGYETPIKDGFLTDLVSGDVDHDGHKELVFLESARNHVDIVTVDSAGHLGEGDRWRVFEERTYRNRRPEASEPREVQVADVTGDKKNDIILIVHDRIILYPQE